MRSVWTVSAPEVSECSRRDLNHIRSKFAGVSTMVLTSEDGVGEGEFFGLFLLSSALFALKCFF